jgi:hypothetical protein
MVVAVLVLVVVVVVVLMVVVVVVVVMVLVAVVMSRRMPYLNNLHSVLSVCLSVCPYDPLSPHFQPTQYGQPPQFALNITFLTSAHHFILRSL